MLTTTLNEILKHDPCVHGWVKLTGQSDDREEWVGNDDPLTFEEILNSNGFDDALWVCRVLTGEDLKRFKMLICDIAERAQTHATATCDAYARGAADRAVRAAAAAAYARGAASAAAVAAVAASADAAADHAAAEREEQIKLFKEFIS